MTTRVVQISKLPARQYRVILECGHQLAVRAEELMKKQLFIDKQVRCPECAGTSALPVGPGSVGGK